MCLVSVQYLLKHILLSLLMPNPLLVRFFCPPPPHPETHEEYLISENLSVCLECAYCPASLVFKLLHCIKSFPSY